jgi:hypothetical protein
MFFWVCVATRAATSDRKIMYSTILLDLPEEEPVPDVGWGNWWGVQFSQIGWRLNRSGCPQVCLMGSTYENGFDLRAVVFDRLELLRS